MGSEAAKKLAALRWEGKTDEEKSEHARMMLRARWAKYQKHKAAKRRARERRRGETE